MNPKAVALSVVAATGAAGLSAVPQGRSDPAQSRAIVIYADVKIGSYAVKSDGTLAGAIKAFGKPTSRGKSGSTVCAVRWRRLGLRIRFYNLGGQDPCEPRYGNFGEALMTGERWRTRKGLRIGDSTRKMRALYRPRRRDGWWIWLITRSTRADCPGVCFYPGLEAKALRGRVAAFRVHYAAGGV